MLVKLTPGVNFTKVIQVAFTKEDPKSTKNIDHLTIFLRFWDLWVSKLCVIMLVKSTIFKSFHTLLVLRQFTSYRAFHRFELAKLDNGGLVLGLKSIPLQPHVPQKRLTL